jgi:hypothetical protein
LKVVAFNVTPEEYKRLEAELAAGGAHSLSDLARAKVMRGVNGNSLAGVARKLQELETAVQQLSEALSKTKAPSAGVAHGR